MIPDSGILLHNYCFKQKHASLNKSVSFIRNASGGREMAKGDDVALLPPTRPFNTRLRSYFLRGVASLRLHSAVRRGKSLEITIVF